MQTGVSMPGETPPAVSEDCLYLNIWTPAKSVREHLPVIVWIYGGGYINGSASMPLYWGDRLAHKGVIVVTIAYRLGPLGFLAHPELTRESPHHSSGNYGLMDQIAALEWIQRNIAAFGGDPKSVTIAGQSSGAISVSILMASPLAKNLFQRAIGESGGLFEPLQLAPKFLLANAERDGREVRRFAWCNLSPRATPVAGQSAHRQCRWHIPPGDRTLCASSLTLRGIHLGAAERCPAADRFERRRGACDDRCHPRDGRPVRQRHGAQRRSTAASAAGGVSARDRRRGEAGAARPGARPPLWLGHVGLGEVAGRNRAETVSTTTRFDSGHLSLPAQSTRGGARATMPSSGTSSTIWTRSPGGGPRQIGKWPRRFPATGSTSRSQAIRTARTFPSGLRSPPRRARSNIWAIRSPWVAWRISVA